MSCKICNICKSNGELSPFTVPGGRTVNGLRTVMMCSDCEGIFLDAVCGVLEGMSSPGPVEYHTSGKEIYKHCPADIKTLFSNGVTAGIKLKHFIAGISSTERPGIPAVIDFLSQMRVALGDAYVQQVDGIIAKASNMPKPDSHHGGRGYDRYDIKKWARAVAAMKQ